jgi:N-methylhydantoinase A/oxoprolinase/acetone carboxylase beta subunit
MAIDIGGTFTDMVLVDDDDAILAIAKYVMWREAVRRKVGQTA